MKPLRRFFRILRQRHKGFGALNAPFEAGQVWAYRTRDSEKESTVCKIEHDPKLGEIVHLYLTKLALRNPAAPEGVTRVITHMPYSGEALRPSLTALERLVNTLPPFQDGYRQWKASFDQNATGVWTVPLAEAVAAMEAVLERTTPTQTADGTVPGETPPAAD